MTHGGNLRSLAQAAGKPEREILDFSANLNPLGPPEWLRPLISAQISALAHYPDPDCAALIAAAAERYGVAADEIIAGNGSTEILHLLPRVLEKRSALIPVPSYVDYAHACRLAGVAVRTGLPETIRADELVFIGQPNNPTGHLFEPEALRALAAQHPSATFIIDEAFADFVEDFDSLTRNRPANVVVLLSLTKSFAIPGLRLGLAVADRAVVQRLRELQPPWTVNTLAQAVGVAALRDQDYLHRTRLYVSQQRESLMRELQSLGGLTVYPGRANFLLVKIERPDLDAPTLARRLLADGIAIRVCDNFEGLDAKHFRVAVRTEAENARLIAALGRQPRAVSRRHKPAIMFQGTSSNAGKSVLTAAFCRILLQDGYRVAPFKSQNMSLNSFVTRDGLEMGRAQVVQAQACRIEPDARMNPILLKPNSDTGSQVIVFGKPVGNMNVGQYIRYKPTAFAAARQAYDELAAEHDALVLEGAGSPAEVNLKHHDIVNMNMARYANAPVLLVGDIDRGGVFASFVGTMEVLAEWERALVTGFVVNRFRGQAALLRDALTYTEQHTGRPVLGVVPFLRDLGLPEEDSVTFKALRSGHVPSGNDSVDIAVVDLPHISNFTDFDALRIEPDVSVRIVRAAAELGEPDAVILPGSKNVLADLAHLRATGIASAIAALPRAEIIGVCGGYQMLGRRIEDPHGIESRDGAATGLGLLSLTTVMAPEKTLVRATARHLGAGLKLCGYEIHHGRSMTEQLAPLVQRDDGETIGVGTSDGRIWGSYLHGIFDADEFRRWFIDRLRQRRGLAPLRRVMAVYDLEPAFERLAATVRESVDINAIYRQMGLR